MRQISIVLVVLFMNSFSINAQGTEVKYHIQSIDNSGLKKDGEGICFVLSLVKEKTLYAVLLLNKELIIDSKEIKIFLNQEQKKEPLIITISTDNINLIKSEKLVAIPFIVIRRQLQNENKIIEPIFTMEDFIPEIMPGITEKDVDELKQEMQKWIDE